MTTILFSALLPWSGHTRAVAHAERMAKPSIIDVDILRTSFRFSWLSFSRKLQRLPPCCNYCRATFCSCYYTLLPSTSGPRASAQSISREPTQSRHSGSNPNPGCGAKLAMRPEAAISRRRVGWSPTWHFSFLLGERRVLAVPSAERNKPSQKARQCSCSTESPEATTVPERIARRSGGKRWIVRGKTEERATRPW